MRKKRNFAIRLLFSFIFLLSVTVHFKACCPIYSPYSPFKRAFLFHFQFGFRWICIMHMNSTMKWTNALLLWLLKLVPSSRFFLFALFASIWLLMLYWRFSLRFTIKTKFLCTWLYAKCTFDWPTKEIYLIGLNYGCGTVYIQRWGEGR